MKRKIRFTLILLFCLMLPWSAEAWDARLSAQIVQDASSFAPKRIRKLVKKHGPILTIAAETAWEKSIEGRSPKIAMENAVQALTEYRENPEKALQALLEAARFIIEASRPTDSVPLLEKIIIAKSCQQAEFDGVQYIENINERIEASKRATAAGRLTLRGWAAGREPDLKAAEAVATSYHIAVNDVADLMATLWKQASGDSARSTIFWHRKWHGKSPEGALSLPKGFDSVPQLAEYYRDINSDFYTKRMEKLKNKSAVPSGFFRFLPLRVVTSEDKEKINEWKEQHPDTARETRENNVEPQAPVELRDEERPELPTPGRATPRREETPVRARPLTEKTDRSAGTLNERSIEETILKQINALRFCHEKASMGEELTGTITVMFTVKRDGTVGDVEVVENSTRSMELGDCVVETLKAARFPRPQKEAVRIRYPFVFQ